MEDIESKTLPGETEAMSVSAPEHKMPSERSLLLFSLWMGVMFTGLGISWGLAIHSGVILFDGIYSGFSIILSMMSIIALRMLSQPEDDNFLFGRMALEVKNLAP